MDTAPLIKQTRDYSLFQVVEGNRAIRKRHVQDIAESIGKKNLLPYNPIIVSEKMEVIDGQHRLKAAEQQNVPVYYTVMKSGNLSDAQVLNNSMKQWNMRNFVESYVQRGNPEYKKLLDFSDDYNMAITISALLLEGSLTEHNMGVVNRLKNGTFRVHQEEEARSFADKLIQTTAILEDESIIRHRDFIFALRKAVRIVDFNKLLRKLKDQNVIIKRCARSREYSVIMEKAYNKNEPKYVRFD